MISVPCLMPVAPNGWPTARRPPSVLTGTFPPISICLELQNAPPSPFLQKPSSSTSMTSEMVKQSCVWATLMSEGGYLCPLVRLLRRYPRMLPVGQVLAGEIDGKAGERYLRAAPQINQRPIRVFLCDLVRRDDAGGSAVRNRAAVIKCKGRDYRRRVHRLLQRQCPLHLCNGVVAA